MGGPDGVWRPICGHWFWDDDVGATAVCKALGFSSSTGGTVTKTKETFSVQAEKIGRCKAGEKLSECSAGGNSWGEYKNPNTDGCGPGKEVGVQVSCSGLPAGSVRTVEKGPLMAHRFYDIEIMGPDGAWRPICGHGFWDDDIGATAVCKALGFGGPSESTVGTVAKTKEKVSIQAERVGQCKAGERLSECSAGGNKWGEYTSGCGPGKEVGVQVSCTGLPPAVGSVRTATVEKGPLKANKAYHIEIMGPDGVWRPICGHWFWDDDVGATAVCKALGFSSSTVGTVTKTKETFSVQAEKIGRCKAGEKLSECSAGGNSWGEYKNPNTDGCGPGKEVGVQVSCSGLPAGSVRTVEKGPLMAHRFYDIEI